MFGTGCTTDDYLNGVRAMLSEIAVTCTAHPVDLIIYNAGTDILERDPLGRCADRVDCGTVVTVLTVIYVLKEACHTEAAHDRINVSPCGVCKRDEAVFDLALKLRTPVCMLLSGGYARGNWRVVLDSVSNLLSKHHLLPDRS